MKRLPVIAALLPVLGIALFFLSHSDKAPSRTAASSTPKAAVAAHSHSPAGHLKKTASKPVITKEDEEAMRRTREINDGLARYAAYMSPTRQQQTVEAEMNRREPGYRTLFATWNMDEFSIQSVLQVIREREAQVIKDRVTFFSAGLSSSGQHQKAKQSDIEWAKAQLVALLGQQHFDELSKAETRMEAEAHALAQARMSASTAK